MTTGSFEISPPSSAEFPSGLRQSPWVRREWSGGNDPKNHKAFNGYWGFRVKANFKQKTQPNAYYPYNPPTYYLTRGLPDPTQLKSEKDVWDGDTFLRACAKCTERIRGHDFYAGNALAEIDESAEMLVKACRNALSALAALAKGNYVDFVRSLPRVVAPPQDRRRLKDALKVGDIPSIWLAAQWGWLPLVADIYSAFDSLEAARTRRISTLFTSKARAPNKIRNFTIDYVNNKALGTIEEYMTVRLLVTVPPSQWALNGFTWQSLFSVVWERIPFSWAFDWFYDVGGFLENWSLVSTLSSSIQTVQFKRIHGSVVNPLVYNDRPADHPLNLAWSGGKVDWEAVILVRQTLPSSYLPLPTLKNMGQAFSRRRLANASAVIYQLASGTKRKIGLDPNPSGFVRPHVFNSNSELIGPA